MFIYRMQRRHFKINENTPLIFPNDVVVKFILDSPSHLQALAQSIQASHNVQTTSPKSGIFFCQASTGRTGYMCVPPEPPLQVTIQDDTFSLDITNDCIILRDRFKSIEELGAEINTLFFLLPSLLTVYTSGVQGTSTISSIEGSIGDTHFDFFCNNMSIYAGGGPLEERIRKLKTVLQSLDMFVKPSNWRLSVALDYFHLACRLYTIAPSPWEFMAEIILNLAKSLQSLFGHSREEIRTGLLSLGYTREQIEGCFIPIMALRDKLDVGHAKLGFPSIDNLQSLYPFLERVIPALRQTFEPST